MDDLDRMRDAHYQARWDWLHNERDRRREAAGANFTLGEDLYKTMAYVKTLDAIEAEFKERKASLLKEWEEGRAGGPSGGAKPGPRGA